MNSKAPLFYRSERNKYILYILFKGEVATSIGFNLVKICFVWYIKS